MRGVCMTGKFSLLACHYLYYMEYRMTVTARSYFNQIEDVLQNHQSYTTPAMLQYLYQGAFRHNYL